MRDPEGNDAIQAYGERFLPSQPLYVNYRPSTVKMHLRFTPRRISPSREAELWEAADNASKFFRGTGITARRATGTTQETEKDQQWVVTIPERLSASGLALLESFVTLAASCMGIEADEG